MADIVYMAKTKWQALLDSIRAKGGTTDLMTADQAKAAVDAIETGGSGYSLDDFVSGNEPSGDVVISPQKLRAYAFYNCKGITSLAITSDIYPANWGINAFASCSNLVSVNAPELTSLYGKCFLNCAKLKYCHFPKVTAIKGDQVIESTSVETLVFPSFTGEVYSRSLRYNRKLETIDFNAVTQISTYAFDGCSIMSKLIIRGSSMALLANISAFAGTPFASGGTGGTLYVPQSLISSYQAATNWSTILGYANNSIQAIEGSIYETQYADGTPIAA